jgi:ABC-type molybdenum transport system ATPase subunit/photorepair protein PhrA
MRINHLLDLPQVSQSSGQTRRGRIAAALLTRPVLLLLEDPMAGLDVQSREEVAGLLGRLNEEGGIRVVLVLRAKGDPLPDWVTDVCEVRQGEVWIGKRAEWEARGSIKNGSEASVEDAVGHESAAAKKRESSDSDAKEPVIKLQDVSVSYGEGTRPVLKSVSWTIQPGQRWHLQGANGTSMFASCHEGLR